MNRCASFSASFSMTGWRPAATRISPDSEKTRTCVAIFGGDFGEGERRRPVRRSRRRVALMRLACEAARARSCSKISRSMRQNFFFGFENLAFEDLQFGSGETLGVDQGLLALVIGGREVRVRFGDFDVVTEDVVEADFERGDAGAGALALLRFARDRFGCCARCRAARRGADRSRREWRRRR